MPWLGQAHPDGKGGRPMTERKPADIGFESWIDRQIREAQERGEFDDLPGAGKPLPDLGKRRDELWWVREKLAREGLSSENLLPTPLMLRKQTYRLRETVRDLTSEAAVREVVADLNVRIMDWLRAPSGPQITVGLVNADAVVEQWKADRAELDEAEVEPDQQPVDAEEPSARRVRWWQRFRRTSHEAG